MDVEQSHNACDCEAFVMPNRFWIYIIDFCESVYGALLA
jgi:hypothetical protein